MNENAGLEADIGITLGKLTQQLAKAEARMIKTAKKFETDFAKANQKVSSDFDRMAKSASDSAKTIGREMDQLRAKYDPVFAASKRYEASLDELNRAQKVGAINTRQYEAALEALNADYARSAGGSRVLSSGIAGVGARMQGARHQIQNTAFQVGDFAVQVGAGTSATQALGQQLPQLLGGFGALGAVMGAVVAVGIPLVSALISTGDAGEDLETKLENLESAVSDYTAAMERAVVPTADLIAKYGTATSAAREFLQALSDINRVEALTALSAALDDIATKFGGFDDTFAASLKDGGLRASELQETIRKVSEEFGIAQDKAAGLVAAMQNLGAAESLQEGVGAAQTLLDLMIATLGPIEDMNAAAREFARDLTEAGAQASEMQGNVERVNFTIQDMITGLGAASNNLGTMIGQAAALGDNMGRAAGAAWEFLRAKGAAEAIKAQTAIGGGRGGDPRTMGGRAIDIQTADAGEFLANYKPPKTSSSSGGGSRGGGAGRGGDQENIFAAGEKTLENLRLQLDLIGKTTAEKAKLTTQQKLLDAAKQKGLDLDARQAGTGETLREQIDRQAEAVGRLTEKYQSANDQSKFWDQQLDSMKDGLVDAIVEGESLQGVLEGVAKSIAKAALQAALFNEGPLKDLFGAGGGLFGGASSGGGGGLLSGLFGGLFGGARASGGPVSSGKTYLVGEKGPELFSPSFAGKITPNNKLGGGGEPVRIEMVNPVVSATDDGRILMQVRAEITGTANQVRKEVPGIMGEHQKRSG